MNANSPNWIQWLSLVLVVLIGVGGIMMYSTIGNVSDKADATASKVDSIKVPTAAEIGAQIVIPQAPAAPVVDTGRLDKLCELTDGCEYFSICDTNTCLADNKLADKVTKTGNDFKEGVSDVVSIPKKYLNITKIDIKDTQVRAYSKADKDNENYEVKLFVRVEYNDKDSSTDTEVVYVLVTGTLDEGNYDGMSVSKVSRTFEFA